MAPQSANRHDASLVACVLAIGGLDPGGGAGILADARAIARAGGFACAACSLLTVQSTSGMQSAKAVSEAELIAACTEVLKHQSVRAIKIGALGSHENAHAVGNFIAAYPTIPVVVDTVMMPTRGRGRLLDERGVSVMRETLMPRATLITVNVPEAEVLSGRRVTCLDEGHEAAKVLLARGARAVLLKGGHLPGDQAVDIFVTQSHAIELSAPRLAVPATHGGGCVLASLIAGYLAVHATTDTEPSAVERAVQWAKKVHHTAIAEASSVGGDLRVLLA
ncbi:MAG: hydroxymethylpyrimidine/phosphomethylpyrimidine kinase [Polyangiaceae bacterium]|nr:hydroxymethylpyrimidine/phosphomethylpyrimidine kinase [Polyangiaceae bacterium]